MSADTTEYKPRTIPTASAALFAVPTAVAVLLVSDLVPTAGIAITLATLVIAVACFRSSPAIRLVAISVAGGALVGFLALIALAALAAATGDSGCGLGCG